jgi:hypothetical protein
MIEGVKGLKPQDMDGPFDKGSPAGAGGGYMKIITNESEG